MKQTEVCPKCIRTVAIRKDGKFATHRVGRSQRHLKAVQQGKLAGTHKTIRTSHNVKAVCSHSGETY